MLAAAALALGALVGLTLALTGAGGGILAVPLLVFTLGLGMADAAPVGLLAVGFAAGMGALMGLREGRVRYRAAAVIGGSGMLAAPLGVALAQRLPNGPLMLAFGAVLAWAGWGMYQRSRPAGAQPRPGRAGAALPCVRSPVDGRFIWTRRCALVLAGIGTASGLLTGLLGVGGGFVIVPALTRWSDLDMGSTVATSLAVIALVSVSGVASAAWHGAVAWPVAAPFALGAAVSLLVARRAARRVSGPTLQRGFAVLSAAVALLLMARGAAALNT